MWVSYLILDNIYGFLYIRREFYWSFVIYRLYGNYPSGEWYMSSGHLYHKLYTYGSKIFLFLMTRRGNNFGHRWCDALIVCSILPLSFILRIWHIRNEIRLIFFVVLCIQPFSYNILRIKNFHIVDPFKIWNDQLAHPKGCVKN